MEEALREASRFGDCDCRVRPGEVKWNWQDTRCFSQAEVAPVIVFFVEEAAVEAATGG